MKPLHTIFSIILCFVFHACNTEHNNHRNIVFETTNQLTARDSIGLEKYGILNPRRIITSNDSIWIVDDERAHDLIHLLTPEGEHVAKGIGIGNGPDEVLEITSIHRVGKSAVIYDARKGIISLLRQKGNTLCLTPLVSQIRMLDDAIVLPDGNHLSVPIVGNYSYGLFDSEGNRLDSLRYYPPKPDGVSDFTHSLACTGHLALASQSNAFARALVYDGGIDFFRISQDSIYHVLRQAEFDMDYAVLNQGQQVPVPSSSTHIGYRSLTASDNLFYSLFSSALFSNENAGSREIQSFAADGTPHRKYLADHTVSLIAVTPNNRALYGIGNEIQLFIFDLP